MIIRCAIVALFCLSASAVAETTTTSTDQATVKQAAGELMGFTAAVIKALDAQEASDQAVPLTVTLAGKSFSLLVKMTPLAHGESIQAIPADATASSPYQELHCVLSGEGKGSTMAVMAITATTVDGANISGYQTDQGLAIAYQSDTLHGDVILNQADQPTLVQATRNAPTEAATVATTQNLAHLDWETGLSLTQVAIPRDTTSTQVPISNESP